MRVIIVAIMKKKDAEYVFSIMSLPLCLIDFLTNALCKYMRYQKNLTILNKDVKKKDYLQNSKQNYFFFNLIEMQRTHIFIHLFRV